MKRDTLAGAAGRETTGKGSWTWLAYLLLGVLATGGYFLLPSESVQNVFYNLVGFSSVVAIGVGIRMNRPVRPLHWYVLAFGMLILNIGEAIFTFYENVLGIEAPFPSVADAFYLAAMPCFAAGLVLVQRRRVPGRQWANLIDALIVGTVAGMLSWIFLVEPHAQDQTRSLFERLISIAYPLVDLVVLVAALQLWLTSEKRLPAHYLLNASLASLLIADTGYTVTLLRGSYQTGDPLDAGWLLFFVLFGAAALHPSMVALSEPIPRAETKLTWQRLVLLTGTLLIAPILLAYQAVFDEHIDVPVIVGCSVLLFVLVAARMAGMISDRKQVEEELRKETALIQLLEMVATTANEAPSLKEAMHACLELICAHTGWSIGHVYLVTNGAASEAVPTDIWYLGDSERFENFARATEGNRFAPGIGLPGRVLAAGKPAWVKDVREDPNFFRAEQTDIGIRSGLAFPVLAGSEVAAVLEFFSTEVEEPDAKILVIIAQVGTQLGRVVERERAEKEIKEGNRRLEELAVLKADFTAMVAHELGGPLAAIRRLSEMLSSEAADREAKAYANEAMLAELDTLDTLVADVQASATMERDDFRVELRPVPLSELLADARTFSRTLPNDHPVEFVLDPNLGPHQRVMADPERIGQVLRNLLSNAAKYSPEGVPIELRAKRGQKDRIRIEVADHGPGIHPEDVVRIFEKFGRGRDREGKKITGVGLGLYLSRGIVQAHGTDITVDSVPGEGAVFGFELEVAR